MFGQVVIGPPGSGKSTYCQALLTHLEQSNRRAVVINLDPANDSLPYPCSVSITQLITVEDVMERLKLGPNGALVYCLEYLEEHIEWLLSQLEKLNKSYLIFDCPGQVELYIHQSSMKSVLKHLVDKCQHRLVSIYLCDSYYCRDPGKFVAVLLICLSTMTQLEMPHINVLSKMDLVNYGEDLAFELLAFTEPAELSHFVDLLPDDPFLQKYRQLTEMITGVVENYALVSFLPLSVTDSDSLQTVLKAADKANGFYMEKEGEEAIKQAIDESSK